MKNSKNKKNNKQDGYAILFTIVMVSVISIIAFGMSNTSYKQLILSSVARDSQVAFYEADTASECAIYADAVLGINPLTYTSWNCGVDLDGSNRIYSVQPLSGGGEADYTLVSTNPLESSSDPCQNIIVTKTGVDPIITNIKARGYNICNKNNKRTLERAIEVSY